jgi:hypothetical protein
MVLGEHQATSQKMVTPTGSSLGGYQWKLKTRNDSFLQYISPSEAIAIIIDDLMLGAP